MTKGFVSGGFAGMNDVVDETDLSTPQLLLNANINTMGSAIKRPGSTLVIGLPGAHSLFFHEPSQTILCFAGGDIYRLTGSPLTHEFVFSTGQPDSPAHYLYVSGLIYISNAGWTGVYDTITKNILPWGATVPDPPILLPGDGNLPNGVYGVCFTVPGVEGRMSGNSRISYINIDHEDNDDNCGGIVIPNLPSDATAWITDADTMASVFYRAGHVDHITSCPENPEPLTSLWGSPPPPLTCLCWAFGRIWGFKGNRMHYSEAFQPELFILSDNYFDLEDDDLGGMIAATEGGLYVGTKNKLYFFEGRNPDEMVQREIGPGVVPGSLCYISEFGDMGRNVPVWIGKQGVYAGNAAGQVINILKEKIKITADQAQGAALFRVRDGKTQLLFSFRQGGGANGEVSMGDDASCEVIRKGTVI